MTRVLFINTPPRKCGVQHFGEATADVLSRSTVLDVRRVHLPEDTAINEYLRVLREQRPDFVLYNYHPMTMPWLHGMALVQAHTEFPDMLHVSIAHDHAPQLPHVLATIHLDPTFEETYRQFTVGRNIPSFKPKGPAPKNVIGTFGYASDHKNFPKVVDLVNAEFDEATVRIHMPGAYYGDPEGKEAERIGQVCRQRAKPGIKVEVTHDFKTLPQLIEWLSGNTVNCFLYDYLGGSGISSAVDYALAAGRPVAISDSYMFRHLTKYCPGVLVENRSLKAIIADGFAPLEPLRQRWSAANLLKDYERIFATLGKQPRYNLTSNRVLTREDREELIPVIEELRRLEPGIMSRKIPEAVFQNAYVFQQAKQWARKGDEIILIGGYEDPIGPALQRLGYNVRITDPAIDGLDGRDVWLESLTKTGKRFDMVISCSVIEHVQDDASFVSYLYALLKPGGFALLTTDYNDRWRVGDHKPDSDVRIYTAERMRFLASQVPEGALLDPPTWGPSEPYFEIVGAHYSFCSLAFRKVFADPTIPPAVADEVDAIARELRECRKHTADMHEAVDLRERYIGHMSGAKKPLQDEIARLTAELDRMGELRHAGQRTLNYLNRAISLARRIPGLHFSLRMLAGLARRTKRLILAR